MRRRNILAIDPGASGAVCWHDTEGIAHSEYMPDCVLNLYQLLKRIQKENPGILAFVEKVGTYMPGNSGPAAATFARHCGQIDGILCGLEMGTVYVRPQQWQGILPLTKFTPMSRPQKEQANEFRLYKTEMERRKRVHKDEIKQYMTNKYSLIKVTLKNADALGILNWADVDGATV